jgi:uncharacterized protein (TIGR03083 family)
MTGEERSPALPTSPVLPAGLRERVIAAALLARAAGRPDPVPEPISPDEAFRRAASAFHELLRELPDADWGRPALRDLDVQGLVGHLTGVEEDVQRCLAGDPVVATADHVASTQAAALRQAGRTPAQTREEWRRAAERTRELALAGDLDAEVAVHGLRIPLSLLLIVRAFELWVHDNDIRQVAGRPPSVPDPATLGLMTEVAARLLPHAAARTGVDEPVSLHLVLTGPGGGTWDVPIGTEWTGGSGGAARVGGAEPADVVIVSDAVDFCRLVANRADPGGLDVHITGDAGLAAAVLAAAPVLALD